MQNGEQLFPVGPLNLPIAIAAERRYANAVCSLARDLPRFTDMPETFLSMLGKAALVSGGPSLAQQLDQVRSFETIVSCGSVYGYLIDRGITPKYAVIFDCGPDHARFYRQTSPDVCYLVASTCDPAVFDLLADCNVRVWHPYDDLPEELYGAEPRVGGGSSATLRGIALAHIMGLRELHMFGFDCSFADGIEHAYPYDQDRPPPIPVTLEGRRFLTTPALLQQSQEFCRMFNDHQHQLAVVLYGDGLAKAMWKAASVVTIEGYSDA